MFPQPPAGYTIAYHEARHLLVAFHATLPTLYLDEQGMQWRVLDQHVSEVHPAQERSS